MRASSFLRAVCFFGLSFASLLQAETNDIYLLIGQSNMAGRAPYVEAEDKGLFPDGTLYILNDKDVFAPIGPYPFINHFSTIRKSAAQIGPGVMFAKTLMEAHPGKPVYIVSNARGGTSIKEWVKGTHYYEDAVRRTKEALKCGQLKGILWHQGETDFREVLKKNGAEAQAQALEDYFALLRQFITDIRTDLNAAELPFVAGQVNQGFSAFNKRILKLPGELPNVFVVTTEGLTTMDDSHFDRPSAFELGRRYGRAMLDAQAAAATR